MIAIRSTQDKPIHIDKSKNNTTYKQPVQIDTRNQPPKIKTHLKNPRSAPWSWWHRKQSRSQDRIHHPNHVGPYARAPNISPVQSNPAQPKLGKKEPARWSANSPTTVSISHWPFGIVQRFSLSVASAVASILGGDSSTSKHQSRQRAGDQS